MKKSPKMRLSDEQKNALAHALKDNSYPCFLYGSRSKPGTRGGDIDLLIYADNLDTRARLDMALKISAQFRMRCDEKIDVTVLSRPDMTTADKNFVASLTLEPLKLEKFGP